MGSDRRASPLGGNVVHLNPEEAVFEAMLRGWGQQQASRKLALITIRQREDLVRRFNAYCQTWPWQWTAVDVEEWTSTLRSSGRSLAHSTIRGYQNSLALFCEYLIDRRSPWAEECIARFGEHPSQICQQWNTARHSSDSEAQPRVRPFSRQELQDFFDLADERVADARRLRRKGWLTAFRGMQIGAIDFDDAGPGLYVYDLAATLSEVQHRPDYLALRAALLAGLPRRTATRADTRAAHRYVHPPCGFCS